MRFYLFNSDLLTLLCTLKWSLWVKSGPCFPGSYRAYFNLNLWDWVHFWSFWVKSMFIGFDDLFARLVFICDYWDYYYFTRSNISLRLFLLLVDFCYFWSKMGEYLSVFWITDSKWYLYSGSIWNLSLFYLL